MDVWLAAPVTCPDCGGDVIIRANFEHALLGGGRSTACRSANQGEGFELVDQTAAAAHIGDVEGLRRHRFWPPIDGALSDVG